MRMSEEQAVKILVMDLENVEKMVVCGLYKKDDFKEQVKAIETVIKSLSTYKKLVQEKNKIISEYAEEIENWKFTKKYVEDNYISKYEIKQIRDKAEVMDYYVLNDVIKDLSKLIGDEEDEEDE